MSCGGTIDDCHLCTHLLEPCPKSLSLVRGHLKAEGYGVMTSNGNQGKEKKQSQIPHVQELCVGVG